jgi:cytochrome c-type biogenesis protein
METIFTSLSIGLLASASPCILPLYPGYLAYLSGAHESAGGKARYFLGFFVLSGVMTMMLVLGLIIALLSISVGRALSVVIPLADLLLVTLGVLLLLDKNPFKALPQIHIPALKNPFFNAFIYGLLYGPIALPCSGPLVVGIFALSLTTAEVLSKLNVRNGVRDPALGAIPAFRGAAADDYPLVRATRPAGEYLRWAAADRGGGV